MSTLAEFKELLNYNPETVGFTWKQALSRSIKIGDTAGCVDKLNGYHQIRIKGKGYRTHRLVWLFETGNCPKGQIDHINNDKLDNHISNLRDVSSRENNQNKKSHRSGRLVGATFHKQKNKWEAQIRINGGRVYLGSYLTELEAHQAYKEVHFEWYGCYPLSA